MKPNRYQNVIEDSRRAGSLIRMFSELSHTDPNTYLNTKMQSLPVKSRFHQLVEIPPEPQKPQTFSPQEIRDKAINFYLEQFAKFRVEIQTTDIITVGLVLDYNGLSMFFEEKTSQRPLFFEYDQIEFEISNKKPRTFRIKVSPTQCFIFNASNQSERSVILKTFLLMKNYGIQDKPFDSSFAIKEFAFDQKFETDLFIKKAWIRGAINFALKVRTQTLYLVDCHFFLERSNFHIITDIYPTYTFSWNERMECYNISSDPRIIVLQFTEENKINFYCESIQLAIILPKMINYFIKGEENRIIPKQEEEKITNEIPIFTETMKTDNSFQYEFYLEANSYEHVTMFKVDDDELEVEDGIEKRKTQPLTSHKSEVFLQTYSMSNIVQMPSQTNQGDLITAPTILKSQGSILKSSTSLLKSNRSFLQSSRGLLKQTSTLLKSNKNLMKKSSNVLRSQDLMPSKSFAKTKSILSRSQTSLKPQLSSVISRELSHISNQSPQDLIYDVLPNEPVYLVDDIPYLHPVSRFNIEIMDEISLQFVPNQDIVFSKYAISIFSKNYRSSIHALGSRMQLFRAKDPLIIRIHFDDGKIYILRFTSEKQVKDFLSILKNCQSHLTDKIIVQNLRKYYPCSVVYKSQQYYGTIIVCDLVLVVLLPFLLRIIPLNKNLTCYRHESNELIRKIVFKNEEYICTYYSQTEQESFKSSFSEALIKYPKKAKEMKESAEQRRVSEVYHHSEKKQRIRTQVTLFEYLFTLGEEPSKYSERINKESTLQIDPMNNLKTKLNFINVSYVISFIDFDEAEKFRYQFSQFIKTGDEMDNLELLEAQKMEKERDNREKEERENEERERLEKERLERERKERERRERERLEKERLERERLEKERLQREREEEERRRKEEEEERERKRKEKEEKKRRKLEKAQRKKEKQEKLEREKRERERRAQELLLAQKEEEERQRLQREKEERERAKMPVLEDNQVVDLQIPDENVEDAILFDVDILDRTSKPIQKGQLKLSPKELVLEIGEESFTFDYDKHKLNTNPRNLMTIRMDFSDSHKIVRFADIDQTKLFFAKFYQFKSLN